MKHFNYIPILKTRTSEIKAVEHLNDNIKDEICPLFELTRSRKSKLFPEGDIYRNLENIKEKFGNNRPFILDVTTIEHLSNNQIETFLDSSDNYGKWVSFVLELKKHFPNLIPTVVSNDSEILPQKVNKDRYINQIKCLSDNFEFIAYRYPADLGSNDCINDFETFQLNGIDLNKLIFIIDHGHFQFITNSINRFLDSRKELTCNIIKKVTNSSYILSGIFVSAENFPQNPSILFSDHPSSVLPIGAYELYNKIGNLDIRYSDYATVYPDPTLQEGGRGWIPRIDLPTETYILSGRERRLPGENYFRPYNDIAKQIVKTKEFDFISKKYPCWGIEEIKKATISPTGLSPSHWISVRVNIHITIRCMMMNAKNEIP